MATKATLLMAAMAATAWNVPAAAQPTRIGGSVEQRSNVSQLIATSAGYATNASIHSSSVIEGASIGGSARQVSTGVLRAAVGLAAGSSATILESSVCGRVSGNARLNSHVGSAVAVSAVPGSSSNIRIASVGRGSYGSARSTVSARSIFVADFIPFVKSTVSIGSYGRGC